MGQSISKSDLALSEAEGLGDTGNEFPLGRTVSRCMIAVLMSDVMKRLSPGSRVSFKQAGGRYALTVASDSWSFNAAGAKIITQGFYGFFSGLVAEQDQT